MRTTSLLASETAGIAYGQTYKQQPQIPRFTFDNLTHALILLLNDRVTEFVKNKHYRKPGKIS